MTVTDSYGTSQTESFVINEPVGFSFTSILTNLTCNGSEDGAIDVALTGSSQWYNYNWSDGFMGEDRSGIPAGNYSLTITDNNGCSESESFVITEPDGFSFTSTTTNLTCNGSEDGAIDITLTGSSLWYNYNWSDGYMGEDRSGIPAGNYSLTITDNNGCSESESFEITEPVGFSFTSILTNLTCNGSEDGAIDITLTGSSQWYNYNWSDGFMGEDRSGIPAGTYSLTITDNNGCSESENFEIAQPQPIIAALTTQVTECDGTLSLTLAALSDYMPVSYLWDNGQSGATATGYAQDSYTVTITVTDAIGCFADFTPNITVGSIYTPISVSGIIVDVSAVGIGDGEIDLTIDGGDAPYVYSWSNGQTNQDITGLFAGNYLVTISDAMGCSLIESFDITEPSSVSSQFIIMASGWNIISSFINPDLPGLDDVTSVLNAGNLVVMKDESGDIYFPTYSLNMIGDWQIGEGYLIYVYDVDTLVVSGDLIDPVLTGVDMPAGWNFFAYYCQWPKPIADLLQPIENDVIIVKDGDGSVYWGGFGVNSIGDMIPGKGYQVKMYDNTSNTLFYQCGNSGSKSEIVESKPVYYIQPASTGNNMTLGIPNYSWNEEPYFGDEIGVFNSQGDLVGSSVYNGGNTAITIWGDDEYTSNSNMLTPNEEFTLRFWHYQTNSEEIVDVISWESGDYEYQKDKIAIVGELYISNPLESEFILYQNVPNPFVEITEIKFYAPVECVVSIEIYSLLGEKVAEVVREKYDAGDHSVEFNANVLPAGSYFYKVSTPEFTGTMTMSIVR